jgi:uncharacterized membrane protein YkoI
MKLSIHQDAEAWAAAAVTGGLNSTELEDWNAHLANCPSCKKLHHEELTMSTFLTGTLQREGPDPEFEQRMIATFRRAHRGRESFWADLFRLPAGLIGAAACVALAVLLGIGFWTTQRASAPTAAVASSARPDSLPSAVQQVIQMHSAGKTIVQTQRNDDEGVTSYDVEMKSSDGEEWSLTIAQDGTVLSMEISLREAPTAVQAAIKMAAGKGDVDEIDEDFDDGEATYVASISTADGRSRDFTFAQDGTLVTVDVDRAELPPAVQTAINTAVGPGKLEGIVKAIDDGDITYEATMTTPTGQEQDFTVSPDGKLLSREVTLPQAPNAVRQTISTTVGTGKVEEVYRSFVATDNVMPYEVEANKDGKPFDFMVAPSGKFLGMED